MFGKYNLRNVWGWRESWNTENSSRSDEQQPEKDRWSNAVMSSNLSRIAALMIEAQ